MRTFAKLALTLGAFALIAGPARAQAPGTYGPGRMMGGWVMVRNKSVQQELKANPEQSRKLDALFEEMRKQGRDEAEEIRSAAPGERAAKFQEFQRVQKEALRKRLDDILKPEQVKRFDQIDVQQAGFEAFEMPRVLEALRLNDVQKNNLQAIRTDMLSALRGAGGDFQKDARSAIAKAIEARARALAKAIALLADDQKATWKDLTGEPFDIKVE